jgi:hypothetical protein
MEDFRKFFDQQERFSKLLEDAARPSEEFRALAARLTEPSPAHQAIAEAAKAMSPPLLSKELERLIDLPGMQSITSAGKRMAEETDPMREQFQRIQALSDSVRISVEHMSAVQRLSEQMSEAAATIHEREPEYLYTPPLPRLPVPAPKMSPAVEVLQVINERLEGERAAKEDLRHSVVMLVTLLDGTQLGMRQMSNDGEHLICITGVDTRTRKERTVTVGAQAFQYEFVIIERKPDLRPVR